MKRALAIEFSRVTEAAALAGFAWLGRGNKDAADEAAEHDTDSTEIHDAAAR